MTEPRSFAPRSLPYAQPRNTVGSGSTNPTDVGLARLNIPYRLYSGPGITATYAGTGVGLMLDLTTVPPGDTVIAQDRWVPVWDASSKETRKLPMLGGGTTLPHVHPESDVINLIPDLAKKLEDAPINGLSYARQDGQWQSIVTETIAWDDVIGKPVTFPPTLPIDQSGVTDLESDLNAIEAKNVTQDSRLTAVEADMGTAFTAINGKVNKVGDTMTGALGLVGVSTAPTAAPGTNSTQIASTAFVAAAITASGAGTGYTKAEADSKFVDVTGDTMIGDLSIAKDTPTLALGKGPNTSARVMGGLGGIARWTLTLGDGSVESGSSNGSDLTITRHNDAGALIDVPVKMKRSTGVLDFLYTPTVAGNPLIGGATIADTPPAGAVPGQFWWESDSGGLFLRYADADSSQWVQVNAKGLADAVSDGKTYARKDGAWFDLAATFAGYLPLTGGTLSGGLTATALTSTTNIATPNGYLITGAPANNILWGFNGANVSTGTGLFQVMLAGAAFYGFQSAGFYPINDNARSLGFASFRWTVVYATTGAINVSDQELKQDIRALDEAELRVAKALKGLIVAYRWKDAVEAKGDGARIHVGVIAQRVADAFHAEGLDPAHYGMWCEDEIVEMVDEERPIEQHDGTVERVMTKVQRGTGQYRYGVRYDELLAFIIGGL